MVEKKESLRETAKNQLPDTIITMAYVEHQMDLMGRLILDLAEAITLDGPALERLNMLQGILEHSSIDFNKLQEPLQAYKIPKTTEYKKNTRVIGQKYLLAQIREGVFGE